MNPYGCDGYRQNASSQEPLRTFEIWQMTRISDYVLVPEITELLHFEEGEIFPEPDPESDFEMGSEVNDDVDVIETCIGIVDAFEPEDAYLWAARVQGWLTVTDLIASVEVCLGIACWLEAREIW
jgi:hypothetical protein